MNDWEAKTFEAEAADVTFDQQAAKESLDELNGVFKAEEQDQVDQNQLVDPTSSTIEEESSKRNNSGMLGVIEIDKINLRLPILYGASQGNLGVGSGLLNGTSLPGAPGNSAIAAHRSRSYGRMFNRLDEIGTGDVVTVKGQNGTFQYKVYETLVVEPEDVSVLSGSKNEKTLTLITCTPIDTATHRLIVKAKQIP
ncbi:class D sortase [Bacillus sp. ISL-35]|uniref:class D sortase n=1 Tax=Bacillus sp. ISL-35 TaxID=2819122 RepID=UPI001BE9C4F0|nr:class D sortase [Bacillus sp. ISL-35]MBT2679105.1 class D sortase [Bacillus sp. ISL-35]MBT2702812.1 class D sortase [Chryseobacterium sp. ISL-80]